MSDRNWLPFLQAIGIAVFIAAGVFLHHWQHQRDVVYEASLRQYEESKRPSSETTAVDYERSIADARTYREEWRGEQDLQAQREMAQWTFYMLCVTAAGVLIAILGIIFVSRTLTAALDANSIAREGERAWLRMEPPEIKSGLKYEASGSGRGEIKIKFKTKNIGRSPAYSVRIHAEIYFHATDWLSPELKQAEFAKTILAGHDNAFGSIVFPDDEHKQTPVLILWPDAAAAARKQTRLADGIDDGYVRPYVIGCVQYLTAHEGKPPSQTGFVYAIRSRREGRTPDWLAVLSQ